MKKKIKLEIEVTSEELDAFLVECHISAQTTTIVNDVNLQPVYQQLASQLVVIP